ncbi:MAG: ribosomal L7Ae/L30e/S12e/Gadd45 family protein [Longimicrobiales bacterium]
MKAEALRLMGLARRAGAVATGSEATRRAIRSGEARLVLTADDASRLQLEKIERELRNQAVPRVILGDRATLGAAVGRGPTTAVAVTGASFAAELCKRLGTGDLPHELEE